MPKKIKIKELAEKGLAPCPVAECGKPFKPTEDQLAVPPKQIPVCPQCLKMGMQIGWWLLRIKIQQGVTPGGIILPGQPGYKADMDPTKIKP